MTKIIISKVKDLITYRPEGMDFTTYKQLLKEQHRRLYGYNVTTLNGPKKHIPGRLEGVFIPSSQYKGHCSKDFHIVIE